VGIYPVICFSVTLCLQITAEAELCSDTNLHGKFDTFNTLFARHIRSGFAVQKGYTSHLPRLGPGTPRGMRSRSGCCFYETGRFFVLSMKPRIFVKLSILALRLAIDVHVRAIFCREVAVE
jgi:hypothetical protein